MKLNIPKEALPEEQEVGFEPIPDGRYQASVFKIEEKTFSTGTKGLTVDFILNGGDYDNRHVFENYFFTDAALRKLVKLMQATGHPYPEGGGDVELNLSAMVGKPVQLKVGHTIYKDKPQNRVEFVDPPPGGAATIQSTGFSGVEL